MSDKTLIGYCDASINPFAGCTRVPGSPGCDHCYAARQSATRLKSHPLYKGVAEMTPSGDARWTGEIHIDMHRLRVISSWQQPKRIFIGSMSDWMHEKIMNTQRDLIVAYAIRHPQHTFMLLTKRADRLRDYFSHESDRRASIGKWLAGNLGTRFMNSPRAYNGELPPENLQLGVTVCNQDEADKNIPYLLQTPAAVRWLSLEPLLGDVDISNYLARIIMLKLREGRKDMLDWGEGQSPPAEFDYVQEPLNWVVIGCESGINRRPCKIEWIENIVEQCRDAGVLVYIKQLDINGKVEHDLAKFPKHLQLRELP